MPPVEHWKNYSKMDLIRLRQILKELSPIFWNSEIDYQLKIKGYSNHSPIESAKYRYIIAQNTLREQKCLPEKKQFTEPLKKFQESLNPCNKDVFNVLQQAFPNPFAKEVFINYRTLIEDSNGISTENYTAWTEVLVCMSHKYFWDNSEEPKSEICESQNKNSLSETTEKENYIPPKFTYKNRRVYEGDAAWEKFAEKLLEYFRPTIPNHPFANKPIQLTDKQIPPSNGYRELLTDIERQLLKTAVPELSDAGLDAVLRDVFNMGDERIKTLTWREIFIFCKHYVTNNNTQANNKLCEKVSGSKTNDTAQSNNSIKTEIPPTSSDLSKQWCNMTHGGIEIMPLEYATYQQPDKPFLPKYPFKKIVYNMFGNGYGIKDGTICNTNPSIIERHRLLMPGEFNIIKRAIKSKVKDDFITVTKLKVFLQREFSITDIESVTWTEIIQYCIDYLDSIRQSPKMKIGKGWPMRVISWIFKKSSHVIYTIIGFIVVTIAGAILLEIFTDFGWLTSIKRFIYEILKK